MVQNQTIRLLFPLLYPFIFCFITPTILSLDLRPLTAFAILRAVLYLR